LLHPKKIHYLCKRLHQLLGVQKGLPVQFIHTKNIFMKKATIFSFGLFVFSILISGMAFAQVTYSGNGNTGFGDVIGNGSIQVSDDGTTVTMIIDRATGALNDGIVIYIDSDESANISTTANLTDSGDDGRKTVSGYTADDNGNDPGGSSQRSTITFANGFLPDYAISLRTDFAGLFEIVENGAHEFVTSVNLTPTSNSTADTYTIDFDFSEIGMSSDSTFKFVANVVSNTAFRSNEAVGTPISGANPGQSSVTFPGYATYQSQTEIDGSAGWRLLSFPTTGGTVSDISDDTAIQGITGGADEDATDSNFLLYDDTADFAEEPTDVSTAFGDGKGFALYFFDNSDNGSSELPVTLDISGSEPSTDVTVDINTVTDNGASNHYFTLVGNPFASNFDLNGLTVDGDGLQDNVHFWDDANNMYQTGDRGTGSFIVAPWQGFWVEFANSTTSTELTFPTSEKTSSDTTATYFSKTVNNRGDINFSLRSDNTMDVLRLAFRDYATDQIDRADATKLLPLVPTYATMAFESNNLLKSVESLPYNLEKEVTLALQPQLVGVSGEFTFAWSGLETIPTEWEIILHDYDSGANIDMRDNSEYVFIAQAEAKSKTNPLSLLSGPVATPMKAKSSSNRFGITLRPTSVNNEVEDAPVNFALEQNYPNPFNPSTTITYSVQEAGAVNISVYNLMGQKVATLVDETKAAGSYNLRWNAAGSASGMYYYRLEAGGQSITRKMTLIK
jgi:hypothetical protein